MRPSLFLILDAVPYGLARTLHERGALPGFGPPRPMVAPFPSLTNVGVPALLRPLLDGRPESYEPLEVTSPEAEEVLDRFQAAPRTTAAQMAVYLLSSHVAYHEIRWFGRRFDGEGPFLGWVNATDAVGHFEGEEAMLLAVADVFASVRGMVRDLDDPLIVLCSDHGMAFSALTHLDSLQVEWALKRAGVGPFTLLPHGDVAAGALRCDRLHASGIAAALAGQVAIDLALARVADDAAEVHSSRGGAVVRWRGRQTRVEGDDLLGLGPLHGVWNDDRALLEATWDGPYPWAPARIRDGLTDAVVRVPAPVLFSMAPGFTYGPPLTHVAARLRGGQVGTHGALLRDQSLGFAASTDDVWPEGPLCSADVLAPFADRLR